MVCCRGLHSPISPPSRLDTKCSPALSPQAPPQAIVAIGWIRSRSAPRVLKVARPLRLVLQASRDEGTNVAGQWVAAHQCERPLDLFGSAGMGFEVNDGLEALLCRAEVVLLKMA